MSKNNTLIQFLNQYTQTVHLPSINKDVSIKPITTGQMKKVLSYDNTDTFVIEDILDDIVKGCIVEEDFNINEITIQDRFDLLIKIRQITKGDDYTFNIKCPKCSTELINNINIKELEDIPYPKDVNYKVKLTDTLSVDLTFVTRGIQKEATRLIKKKKGLNEDQKVAEMATYIYTLSMTTFYTPAGEISDASIEDKKELLDNLNESVYDNINKWYEKYNYGINFKYKPKCKFCDWEEDEQDIPLTSFFF